MSSSDWKAARERIAALEAVDAERASFTVVLSVALAGEVGGYDLAAIRDEAVGVALEGRLPSSDLVAFAARVCALGLPLELDEAGELADAYRVVRPKLAPIR